MVEVNQQKTAKFIVLEKNTALLTYTLKPLKGILQVWVDCHIRPNTIEYTADLENFGINKLIFLYI